eukprot:CAMPEP_0197290728 /NCGR_PEP_ID=MMETSP0890-20130614/9529_1 /TAXON_ID=44058 ORGANISM="Aureoumbra lagunensis, Strain CCMP1510" /NCGR_SAMPLE_ID=MMETSP0890 /ASSEMBLY_ACC=CAM_ASM_000533 /LENGTH=362 /DNA_ID=CAMNT_0042762957 /DNA_START=189 /DNA_END=1277 /DNA_ORIENTATION=-
MFSLQRVEGLQVCRPKKLHKVPFSVVSGASIVGVGSVVPETQVGNNELISFLDTSDEWISQRTGIRSRKLLCSGEKLSEFAAEAASQALLSADVNPTDVDLVIVATSSPEDMFGDATKVANLIGASKAVAFDLTAACSGFLFALITASQFLETGTYETAVVVGADALSRWVDWSDRSTCVLFGDGAGAVVLKKKNKGGILSFALKSNGADQRHLTLGYHGKDKRLALGEKGKEREIIISKGGYAPILMNGKEVYKFATREVPKIIFQALEYAELSTDNIDWLLLHQANIRIIETVADRLGISRSKIISNLDEHGNTSAGSIPIALDHAVKSGLIQNGHIIAMAGFGAGLSWGAAIIRWDDTL